MLGVEAMRPAVVSLIHASSVNISNCDPKSSEVQIYFHFFVNFAGARCMNKSLRKEVDRTQRSAYD